MSDQDPYVRHHNWERAVLSVVCPFCDAQAGVWCSARKTKHATWALHRRRVLLAQERGLA